MKELIRSLGWLISILLLVVIVSRILLLRPHPGNNSEPASSSLLNRLEQIGVPVKSVQALKQSPLQVEIVLESSSDNELATPDDLWNNHLASREAELAYLTSVRIDSYRSVLVNTKGDIISSEWVFLDQSRPSQNLVIAKPSAIDVITTQDLLKNSLDTSGMAITSLEVSEDRIVRTNTKLVELILSTKSIDTANQTINTLIFSLRPLLRNINEKYGAQIALFRLRIMDAEGKLLVEYILDLDTQSEDWSTAKGIKADWFARPVATPTPFIATPYP